MTLLDEFLTNKELEQENNSLQVENIYLKSELEKYNTRACVGDLIDATDYKTEYMNLREQFDNAIKTIKYISSLL